MGGRKVPLIAGVELAINESYNALDWYLSYRRLAEANAINGRVLAAAKQLQSDIDDTYLDLRRMSVRGIPGRQGRATYFRVLSSLNVPLRAITADGGGRRSGHRSVDRVRCHTFAVLVSGWDRVVLFGFSGPVTF